MKNKILLFLIILLLPFAVISFFKKETNFNLPTQSSKTNKQEYIINLKTTNNEIIKLDLEDYVLGVVAGEMPASFELEALKAQAIAARTYVLYKKNLNKEYDVSTTVNDQVYINNEEMKQKWNDQYNKYYEKIKTAVESTKGQVIKYNNQIIKSYYFSQSNGYTENALNVFNEAQDYLTSVDSTDENTITNNITRTTTFNKEDFCKSLNINCNEIIITNIIKSETGRVNKLTINNRDYSGTEIRKLLNLRSTDFTIKIFQDTIEITTNGYGHGVGMSQYGANAMAKKGSSYAEIIKHYYKDVTISSI